VDVQVRCRELPPICPRSRSPACAPRQANFIRGSGGNDTIIGGAGIDVLWGGAGNDLLRSLDGEIDSLDGGPGDDEAHAAEDDLLVDIP
jgi:Ca2+-binding RTX toxin-like protein